jgi:hypothetical protein
MSLTDARARLRDYVSRSFGHAFVAYGSFFAFWMFVAFALDEGPSIRVAVSALVSGVLFGLFMATLHPRISSGRRG